MSTTIRVIHLGKKPYTHALSQTKDILLFLKVEFCDGETAMFTYAIEVDAGEGIDLNGQVPDGATLVAYYEPRSDKLQDPDETSDLELRRYEKSRHRELYQALRRIGENREDSKEKARREVLDTYRKGNVPRRLAI